eukprot:TCONS_00001187-protein
MADYWKSTGKHYCDFCKCWTADNKPSIQFHEKGKNHQANVKKRLAEIKRNSIEKRKKDEKSQHMFQEMEKAALAAVQKDMNSSDVSIGKADMRNIVKAHSKTEESGNDDISNKDIYPWQVMAGPQGTTYYYNATSGESTWVMPEIVKNQLEKKKRTAEDTSTKTVSKPSKSYSSSTSTASKDPYRAQPKKEEPPEEVRDSHPLLGGWSTVKRYDNTAQEETSEEQNVKEEQPAEKPTETTEAPENSGTTPAEPVAGKKFKERQLKTSLATESDAPVAFKKRKFGNRNVRRRNDDD